MAKDEVGTTHNFVLAQRFAKVGPYDALVGADGTKRMFAELYADPDRPHVRPQEAYHALLTSMQPGWTLRLLQVFWPDPQPRLVFQRQVEGWQVPESEGLDILHQGLIFAAEQFPLPFERRTILEFVFPGEEGLAWWEGMGGLCQGFGVRVSRLDSRQIESVLLWIFTPSLG